MTFRRVFTLSLCLTTLFFVDVAHSDTTSSRSVQDELDALKKAFSLKAPQEKILLYEEGIRAVRASGVENNAVQVGEVAPDFTLNDHGGFSISLSSLLSEGHVVLVWYRGGWCPYCNIYLRRLQEVMPEIIHQGARIIALAPEKPEKSLITRNKNQLNFTMLYDKNNTVAERYDVVFTLPADVAASYKQAFDLAAYNGSDSYRLPLSATYIIDKEGMVRYAFLDADYRKRAEPADIITELTRINLEDAAVLTEDAQ